MTKAAFAALILVGLSLAGCGVQKPATDPVQDKKARDLFLEARQLNGEVKTSKGTGLLTITAPLKSEQFKIAWAAHAPNRLRMTLLKYGHPVETIAASGKKVTFISHTGRHSPHTTLSADPNLETYIGVPVLLSEMIRLFLGQVPVRKFDRAWMVPGQESLVHASEDFNTRIQQLLVDDKDRIKGFRILDSGQDLIFGMAIKSFTEKKGFSIPDVLSVYDASGRNLEICLTNFVPNAPVKESMFILTAP